VRPIQKLQLLTPFELFEIFSDIEVIAALNQILLNKLEERYKEWPRVATFADIFKENVSFSINFATKLTKFLFFFFVGRAIHAVLPLYSKFHNGSYQATRSGDEVPALHSVLKELL